MMRLLQQPQKEADTPTPPTSSREPVLPLRSIAVALGALFLAHALSGCSSIRVAPVSPEEIATQSASDRRTAYADVEPLSGALTLEDAIARALKYNLEGRVRSMEQALALNQFDASQYDMLPKLVASAGYRERDSDLITRSKDSVTGQPSLAHPFISSDRSAVTTELGFTWSLLDFGLSYYNAKQNADRVLIASERRRKAVHTLIQNVHAAFWRAASAEKLRGQIRMTVSQAEEALADARKAEAERLRSPLESLRYQRQLLENLRLLEAIDQDLSTARVELMSLVNLPLAANFQISEPNEELSRKILDMPVEQMEEVAIARNADLREQYYNARIAGDETRKTIAALFPGLSFNYSLKHSDDSFLINKDWQETGLQLSFNLFNLLSAPSRVKMAEAGVAVADTRRVATQMAVLTQVHIARLQYANATQQFERADAVWRIDDSIARHVGNQAQAETQSRLERISNQTTAILSLLRRYNSLAQAHAAASRLQSTLGMEPEIPSTQEASLNTLSGAISSSLRDWQNGRLPSARERN
jgi:outer membrane protein TolC